jgi:hypothetical protein
MPAGELQSVLKVWLVVAGGYISCRNTFEGLTLKWFGVHWMQNRLFTLKMKAVWSSDGCTFVSKNFTRSYSVLQILCTRRYLEVICLVVGTLAQSDQRSSGSAPLQSFTPPRLLPLCHYSQCQRHFKNFSRLYSVFQSGMRGNSGKCLQVKSGMFCSPPCKMHFLNDG